MNEPAVKPIISDTVLLWIALGIALLFVGGIIYDYVKRRRRKRRHSHGGHGSHSGHHSRIPEQTWRDEVKKPFQWFREVREAFAQLARRRARHQRHEEQRRLARERRRQAEQSR